MPAFNQSILNGFVEVFTKQAEILVKQLHKMASKEEFDIYDYISKSTLDTFCGKTFLYYYNFYKGSSTSIFLETSMGVTINAQTTDCQYMKWITR